MLRLAKRLAAAIRVWTSLFVNERRGFVPGKQDRAYDNSRTDT